MTTLLLDKTQYEQLRRVHVTKPHDWARAAGTDFWLMASANGMLSDNAQELADYGWTTTSLAIADGSGADFISASDPGTPGLITTNAAADLLTSPAIFGSYAHAHQAMTIMGEKQLPNFLCLDAYATFSTLSADEVTTNLGFVEDGGSPVVAADIMASFYSKGTGTTFNNQSNAAIQTGLVANDTSPHWFRILLNKLTSKSYFYIDGVYNGELALTADEFPVKFGFGNGTTNRINLSIAHVYYSWRKPFDVGSV